MKKILALVLLIVSAAASAAQKPEAKEKAVCGLTVAQSPAVNGLKLGLTIEQVLGLFPGSSNDGMIRAEIDAASKKQGLTSFSLEPSNYLSSVLFPGITRINFKFMDGRLYHFTIGYNGPKWKDVDEFVGKFAAEANLPGVDNWNAYVGLDTQLKMLNCQGFEVRLFAGGPGGNLNSVELRDLGAEQTLKDRRVKARAAKTSKP